ncbi:MAG TPA: hypothetical protein VEF76_00305 [Patescibacteria group bacterium]|nr:hypothetical protein [Patescibacteria group bacterium]
MKFVLTLLMLISISPARAESPDEGYLALVDQAVASPGTAKWCEIRESYPGTTFYRALGNPAQAQKAEAAGKKIILEKSRQSVDEFKKFMREHFGNLGAHRYAAYLYKWNRELVKEGMEGPLPDFGKGVDYIDNKLEKLATKSLLDCIIATGSGRDRGNAFRVITADEQRILVEQYFRVDATESGLSRDGEKVFSTLKVKIPDGPLVDVYFELDPRMVARMRESMQPRP